MKEYYDALQACLSRYGEMAAEHRRTDLIEFIAEFDEAIANRNPLLKLNRWIGYIQGTLISIGATTVEAERDWTRPLFRPIDFGKPKGETDTHCSECGTPYLELVWPRKCTACGVMKWNSPKPVVTILQPVFRETEQGGETGLLIAKRAIQPQLGKWSLLSGYVDPQDGNLISAIAREKFEETALTLAGKVRLVHDFITLDNRLLLFFLVDTAMPLEAMDNAQCCSENSELAVMWRDDFEKGVFDVGFPTHREVIERWFKDKYRDA